jgi:osmoprotectant transport system ATP-binding protein
VITYRSVSHAYEHAASLQSVSLEVARGETVAVIGPSGCGKSTLLKIAAGLLAPLEGTVSVAGRELCAEAIGAIRRRVGYVIQSGGLFPHLTAEQNVTLAARSFGQDAPSIVARVRELTELVQLPSDVLQRRPGDLSGGQRQRVSLMRALMLDPDVLLLDEPFGALDPMVRFALQVELRELFSRLGKSVLLVTHDLAEAAFLSSHLVLMRAGRIVQQGTLRELTQAPVDEFVREFVRAQRALHVSDAHA